MAEEYEDAVSKQPGGRLSKADIQRARYGSKLDERRHDQKQAVYRVIKFIAGLGGAGGVIAEALKFFHVGF